MYFEARYLDTASARFMSRDPVALAFNSGILMRDPQTQNSYSYSRNNPVNYIDPDGEFILQFMFGMHLAARASAKFAINNPVAATQSGVSMIPYVGDSMDVYETVSGKNAFTGDKLSTAERVITGGAALLPVVGGSLARNVGGEVIRAGSNIGDDIGKLGTVIDDFSQQVTGYTTHGLNQKITREVSSSTLLNTVRDPLVTIQQSGGTVLRLSQEAGVVLNDGGKVVTTYGKQQFNSTIDHIINNTK